MTVDIHRKHVLCIIYLDNRDRWTPFCVTSARGGGCCALKYYIVRRRVGCYHSEGSEKQKYDSFFVHFRHIIVVTLRLYFILFFFFPLMRITFWCVYFIYIHKLFDLHQAWAPHLAHLSHSHRTRGFVIILYSGSEEHTYKYITYTIIPEK